MYVDTSEEMRRKTYGALMELGITNNQEIYKDQQK